VFQTVLELRLYRASSSPVFLPCLTSRVPIALPPRKAAELSAIHKRFGHDRFLLTCVQLFVCFLVPMVFRFLFPFSSSFFLVRYSAHPSVLWQTIPRLMSPRLTELHTLVFGPRAIYNFELHALGRFSCGFSCDFLAATVLEFVFVELATLLRLLVLFTPRTGLPRRRVVCCVSRL